MSTYQIQFVNEELKVIIVTLQSKKNILIFMKTNMYTLPTFQEWQGSYLISHLFSL